LRGLRLNFVMLRQQSRFKPLLSFLPKRSLSLTHPKISSFN
jgi:hypothetical protein